MDKNNLVVATISLVRNADEEVLLTSSLAQLSRLNIPVYVTDGGSPEGFLQFLQGLPNVQVLHTAAKGVFAQARNSVVEAAKTNSPFIFYTEPDKEDFFRHGLPQMLTQVQADDGLGVVMASRSKKGLASFPSFQQMTETAINNCCEELIGLKTDYCYGPFLFNKKLVTHLNDVKEDIGWGWRPFVFNTAHKLGLRVESCESDFLCPESQREDDARERLYRMKQLEQNIRGLVLSAS